MAKSQIGEIWINVRKSKGNMALLISIIVLSSFAIGYNFYLLDSLKKSGFNDIEVERSYEGSMMNLITTAPLADPADNSTWFFASGPANFSRHVYTDEVDGDTAVVKQDVRNDWLWSETYYFLDPSTSTPHTGLVMTLWDNTTHAVKTDIDEPCCVNDSRADRDRSGCYSLFVPAHLSENEDVEDVFFDETNTTETSYYQRSVTVKDLKVYEYFSHLRENLTATLGVYCEVNQTVHVEPNTGSPTQIVNKTVTFFSDSSYSNIMGRITIKDTADSADDGISDAKDAKSMLNFAEKLIPLILVVAVVALTAILAAKLMYLDKKKIEK